MSEVPAAEKVSADVPDYPMERAARCPFAPPRQMLEMGEAAPLSRVRIWNGTTPWLITGHEVARQLLADSRVSVDDRSEGFPHWNEHSSDSWPYDAIGRQSVAAAEGCVPEQGAGCAGATAATGRW